MRAADKAEFAFSEDEIKEVILHSAVYAGVPRANSAFAIAQKVLAEERDAE